MTSLSSSGKMFKLALIQLYVGANSTANLSRAIERIGEAAKHGAQVVSLPECFNSPYGTKYFTEYAESVSDGTHAIALKEAAQKHKIYLIGSTYPEKEVADGKEKIVNTSVVWSPKGNEIGLFRKMHFLDVDAPNKVTFPESNIFWSGYNFTAIQTPLCKIGLGMFYDIMSPDVAQIYARNHGCHLLVYTGVFNMTTGPAHSELLARVRALDNQVYVASVSPARGEVAGNVAWDCCKIVDPSGTVVASASEAEEIIYADIDLNHLESIRGQMPVTFQQCNSATLDNNHINRSIKKEDNVVKDTINMSDLFKEDKKVVGFCRCWKSSKFPRCDGAHIIHNRMTGDNISPILLKKGLDTSPGESTPTEKAFDICGKIC